MQVFIMRHGEAALDAASDSVRPLTHCGCNDTRQMASWFQSQSLKIEHVLVSPYLRAVQTLAIVRQEMTLPEEEEVLAELTPEGDPASVACYLNALAGKEIKAVLLISHLPLVGYLVSELCPQEAPPMFATSAIASVNCFNGTRGENRLDWLITPKKLAKAI